MNYDHVNHVPYGQHITSDMNPGDELGKKPHEDTSEQEDKIISHNNDTSSHQAESERLQHTGVETSWWIKPVAIISCISIAVISIMSIFLTARIYALESSLNKYVSNHQKITDLSIIALAESMKENNDAIDSLVEGQKELNDKIAALEDINTKEHEIEEPAAPKQDVWQDEAQHGWLGVIIADGYIEGFTDLIKGAVITEAAEDMPAYIGGLRAGDLITGINGVRITGKDDLVNFINTTNPGDKVTVIVSSVTDKGLYQESSYEITLAGGTINNSSSEEDNK